MSDIQMCLDNECPSRTICKRHEASGTKPNPHWQAYGGEGCPRGLTRCPAFWPAPGAEPLPLVRAPESIERD